MEIECKGYDIVGLGKAFDTVPPDIHIDKQEKCELDRA